MKAPQIQTQINWQEANEVSKQSIADKEQHEAEYKENLESAKGELYEAMGNADFRYSDFEDIASDYGIDDDDLLFSMI